MVGDFPVALVGRVLMALLFCICPASLLSQWTEAEVQDVAVDEISPLVVRLSWAPVPRENCGDTITYSVYRGKSEDFEASEENEIASDLARTSYVTHEPKPEQTLYYRVWAFRENGYCAPTTLKSGSIVTFPLDLGRKYPITVGETSESCEAKSTSELKCDRFSDFHAVVVSQNGHEFLIGCLSSDYEGNNWTCVNLTPGSYHVSVHSLAVTVWGAGISKVNVKTGKTLGAITPVFSMLAVLK